MYNTDCFTVIWISKPFGCNFLWQVFWVKILSLFYVENSTSLSIWYLWKTPHKVWEQNQCLSYTSTHDAKCTKRCIADGWVPHLGHLLVSVIGWELVTSGYIFGSPGLLLISLALATISFLACSLLNSSGLSGSSTSGSFNISWSLASSS